MMAGVQDPSALGLGEQLFAACIVGFALQHYYLDARIWRVSRIGTCSTTCASELRQRF
jgi:hypothetical protein